MRKYVADNFVSRLKLAYRTFKEGIDYSALPIYIADHRNDRIYFCGVVYSIYNHQQAINRHGIAPITFTSADGVDRFSIFTS